MEYSVSQSYISFIASELFMEFFWQNKIEQELFDDKNYQFSLNLPLNSSKEGFDEILSIGLMHRASNVSNK